jgi:antitoxin ParD1/3/4
MSKIDIIGHIGYGRAEPEVSPMNVHLTPELEKLVQGKVESGRYNSASEVVREALRLMEQKDELRAVQLHELRSRIGKGLAEAGCGQVADGDVFMQGLLEDLDRLESKRKAG